METEPATKRQRGLDGDAIAGQALNGAAAATAQNGHNAEASTSSSSSSSIGINAASANGENARAEMGEQMTEEEAALYDRQLRLWGSVAQSRIRQCRVLITPFQGGIATETAKNLILAGIKELIMLDDGEVEGWNLTAGFVWRDEDVGKKRVEAATERLAMLNPHVKITAISKPPTVESIQEIIQASTASSPLSSVVYTNSNPFSPHALSLSPLQQLDTLCRSSGTKLAISQGLGLDGWIFQDLGPRHQFLVEKKSTKRDSKNATVETTWSELQEQSFVTLEATLSHVWKARNDAAKKRMIRGTQALWGTWAIWHLIEEQGAKGPEDVLPSTLLETVERLMGSKGLDVGLLWDAEALDPQEWAESFLRLALPAHPTQPSDFAPTSAILGGILAQEILNAVGGREVPKVANWLVVYGLKGQAPVFSLGGIEEAKKAPVEVDAEAGKKTAAAVP